MSTYVSPLRELAREVRDTARKHACWSQVYALFQLVDEHLTLMARVEEINQNSVHGSTAWRQKNEPA